MYLWTLYFLLVKNVRVINLRKLKKGRGNDESWKKLLIIARGSWSIKKDINKILKGKLIFLVRN